MVGRIAGEIKDEIIKKTKSGQRVADLADQYGISSKTIYSWLRQSTGEEAVSIIQHNKLIRENAELKRIIGELTLDMSWKKKSRYSKVLKP